VVPSMEIAAVDKPSWALRIPRFDGVFLLFCTAM